VGGSSTVNPLSAVTVPKRRVRALVVTTDMAASNMQVNAHSH
jgi:hypothetical protein